MSETYESGTATMILYPGEDRVWIQSGVAGLWLTNSEFACLFELMQAYVEECNSER